MSFVVHSLIKKPLIFFSPRFGHQAREPPQFIIFQSINGRMMAFSFSLKSPHFRTLGHSKGGNPCFLWRSKGALLRERGNLEFLHFNGRVMLSNVHLSSTHTYLALLYAVHLSFEFSHYITKKRGAFILCRLK
jgi:hypothetical protein